MEFTAYNKNSKCKEKIIKALKVSLKSTPEFYGHTEERKIYFQGDNSGEV